jgi:head-tail adaptor
MPTDFGAGQLKDRMSFQSREPASDAYGNRVGDFIERFQEAAKLVNLRGGETITAARLSAKSVVLMQVRASQQTAGITPDWRVVDTRRGTVYNVREIHLDRTNALFEIMIETGVAV